MNLIGALLWKEGRAVAYKAAAAACLALLSVWTFPLQPACHVVGVLGAVLLGMDLVAGERSRGTLPFLSNLPVRTAWLLGAKYAVGAAGLLVVLAAYWAGVFLGMPHWGSGDFLWSPFWHSSYGQAFDMEILKDVGYGRILLFWFLLYLIFYSGAFLSSALSSRPFQAAWTSLLMAFVGLTLLAEGSRLSDPLGFLWWQILGTDLSGPILRSAFDPTLLLARTAVALLVAGCVLAWTCRTFRRQGSRRFQWTMVGLFLMCLVVEAGYGPRFETSSKPLESWIEPVGRLPYETGVVDLAVKDRMAIVLLTSGLSVVDVADWQAPREIGRVEIDGWQPRRLAVSASAAYVWGWTEKQDSAGVAVFDLSLPERPRLQARRLLYPIEPGPTHWLKHTPRLTAWAVRDGYLYAGLLGSEFLELLSFDVRSGGAPPPVQALQIEKTARHVWNNDWQMLLAGEKAFFTLGHDFVILDLADPAAMQELSRTSLSRLGHSSRRYEELMETFHLQLSQLPDEVTLEMEGQRVLVYSNEEAEPVGDRRHFWISVPPALASAVLVGDKAYVPRNWLWELAVLDISDPRRPVEVGYTRGKSLSQLVQEGELVDSLAPWGWSQTHGVDPDGTAFVRTGFRRLQRGGDPARALISVGGHACAIADSSLVIFRIPRTN